MAAYNSNHNFVWRGDSTHPHPHDQRGFYNDMYAYMLILIKKTRIRTGTSRPPDPIPA